MNNFDRVREFHEVFSHPINEPLDEQLKLLRERLIAEEKTEVVEELFPETKVGSLTSDGKTVDKQALTKELADLLYVTYGTAVTFGLPLQEVFEEVHKSNLSKLGEDGKPVLRSDGKVLKGPNYKEPELKKYFV